MLLFIIMIYFLNNLKLLFFFIRILNTEISIEYFVINYLKKTGNTTSNSVQPLNDLGIGLPHPYGQVWNP